MPAPPREATAPAPAGEPAPATPASLADAVAGAPGFRDLLGSGAAGPGAPPRTVGPAHPAAWSLVAAAVARSTATAGQRRLWAVCHDVKTQERLHAELMTWGVPALFFPELDPLVLDDALPDPESSAERLEVLEELTAPAGAGGERSSPAAIIVLAPSLDEDVPAPSRFADATLQLTTGQELEPAGLVDRLAGAGYDRVPLVTERGQFAVRGGILDIYSWQAPSPARIEFFGDEIEAIRLFDVHSQASFARPGEVSVFVSRPSEKRRGTGGFCKLRDYIGPGDSVAVFGDPVPGLEPAFHITADPGAAGGATACYESPLAGFGAGDFVLQEAKRKAFYDQLAEWDRDGWQLAMFFNNRGEVDRFQELLTGEATSPSRGGGPLYLTGSLARGFTVPAARIAVLTDAEIFGRYQHQRARRAFNRERAQASARKATSDVTEFEDDDLVVHLDYGIARFRGLDRHTAATGNEEDALTLEFADGATLYVPVDQAHLVSRYVGAGAKAPRLSRLGDGRWTKARTAAVSAIEDYAAALLSVQAERQTQAGFAHPPDSRWQYEFEQSFLYQETPDQLRAIEEAKRDMESPRPMDRLVCGDVGFGKTEVAIRAAFKAVMGGKQVAVLVPTTVLADQHLETFRERMSDYPVRIEQLSRFRTAAQQRETLSGLATGAVDIVIGTHRLISKDVAFKDLGLVVIDEEQRFGVKHKERFKSLFRLIDVLTLSATPIPRTLYLSLMGARDMSTIETPPPNRVPVDTAICGYDERLIRSAIERELSRGGQVFFLHNRVKTINALARKIAGLCPDARIAVGHGQMGTGELEEVMHGFVRGHADVLLCTTIIESGVDIPNANTIIIDRADRFGLADLYQLRGRVGRSGGKAYAILLLPRDLFAGADARKRISAIKQYTSLGSGFKIAMRDLEIRGAGSLLGLRQSGHISAVGFDLYCKLLRQSVAKLQGKPSADRADTALHTDFLVTSEANHQHQGPQPGKAPAFIPSRYIEDPPLRIAAYRDLAACSTAKELATLVRSWRDRFGPEPPPVTHLADATALRIAAHHANITAVEILGEKLMLTRNGDYILVGGRFPRLQATSPEARLREALDMVRTS